MTRPHRVAFFGGTFDPVHLGHIEIASKARRALQLEKLIFIPCKQSPHKDSGPIASDTDRLQMLHLATMELDWASISDFELTSPPPSFTWKTLETLIPQQPAGARCFLLIGHDQWTALPRWQHPEKIATMVEFIVVGRNGQPSPRQGFQAHFLRGDHPASASAIRKSLSNHEPTQWLAPKVRTYLTEHCLYLK